EEEPHEAIRVGGDGGGHRVLVAGEAGNQRRARLAMAVQFAHPPVRQRACIPGRLPSKLQGHLVHVRVEPGGVLFTPERLEEPRREEVAMAVVKRHASGQEPWRPRMSTDWVKFFSVKVTSRRARNCTRTRRAA